ncbi:MAG: peptidylprolyl isomerase [Planctomycetes bacterium]|nr:peptidylprolyl isomerase [Planctomycetota bacterium]
MFLNRSMTVMVIFTAGLGGFFIASCEIGSPPAPEFEAAGDATGAALPAASQAAPAPPGPAAAAPQPAAASIQSGHTGAAAPVAAVVKAGEEEVVILETSKGRVAIRLFDQDCPRHTGSFKKLVREGFFNGAAFHRVFSGYFAQGGEGGQPCNQNHLLPLEPGRKHLRGAVAGAPYLDQSRQAQGTAGCQFYVCMRDLPEFDGKYTVFGEVIEGMDVIDHLQGGAVENNGYVPADKADRIVKAAIEARPKALAPAKP